MCLFGINESLMEFLLNDNVDKLTEHNIKVFSDKMIEDFIKNFEYKNQTKVIFGNNKNDVDNEIDNLLYDRRVIFHKNLIQNLKECEYNNTILVKSENFLTNFVELIQYIVVKFINKTKKYNIVDIVNTKNEQIDEYFGDCCICFDHVFKNDKIKKMYLTKCNHIYHLNCLNQHYVYSKNCPLCKTQILL